MRMLSAGVFAFGMLAISSAAWSQTAPAPSASPASTASPTSTASPLAQATPVVQIRAFPPALIQSITNSALGVTTIRSFGPQSSGPMLSVSGRGSVTRKPDRATLTIQLSAQGDTPENVIAAVASSARELQAAIAHVSHAEVTTTSSQLSLYGSNPSVQINGSATLEVALDDVRSVSAVRIAVASAAGATVSNIRYDVSDRADADAEALAAALKDARAQFDALASKSSLKIVRIGSIQDNVYQGQSGESATAITIEASATIAYEVSPT